MNRFSVGFGVRDAYSELADPRMVIVEKSDSRPTIVIGNEGKEAIKAVIRQKIAVYGSAGRGDE